MYKKGDLLQHKHVVSVLLRVTEDVPEGCKTVTGNEVAGGKPLTCNLENVKKLG